MAKHHHISKNSWDPITQSVTLSGSQSFMESSSNLSLREKKPPKIPTSLLCCSCFLSFFPLLSFLSFSFSTQLVRRSPLRFLPRFSFTFLLRSFIKYIWHVLVLIFRPSILPFYVLGFGPLILNVFIRSQMAKNESNKTPSLQLLSLPNGCKNRFVSEYLIYEYSYKFVHAAIQLALWQTSLTCKIGMCKLHWCIR